MSTLPLVYTDQFGQSPMKGDLDLAITKSGVISGTVYSAVSTDTFASGSRVKLDTSYAVNAGLPRFVAAADNEAAFGFIKRTGQKTLFEVGDKIEVVMGGNPSVTWQCSGTTIEPFTSVGMSSGFLVDTDGTHLEVGYSLDYGIDSQMIRVIHGFVAC